MPTYRLKKGSVQFGFSKSRAKVQIFSGGFGNGKTTAAVVTKALQLSKDYPGSNGLIARGTYPKLNDTIRREFLKWCPPHWIKKRPTQDDNSVYLVNGSEIHFRYIQQRGKKSEDGSTSSNLLSASYDWIVVDQIEDPEIVHKDFLDLLGRLRGRTPYKPSDDFDETMPADGPRWLVLTANPNAGWFYKEVVLPFITWRDHGLKTEKLLVDAETSDPIVDLFEDTTYGNADNLAPDYIKGLEAAYKGQMRERFLLGKWAAFEGLVFSTYAKERHTLSRDWIEKYIWDCKKRHVRLRVIEGYDFGLTSPSCYLLAIIDDFGRVIIIDGFHRADFSYVEQPDEIFRIRAKYQNLLLYKDKIYADPACFKRIVVASERNVGETVAKLFSAFKIEMRPAANDILPGIAKVNSYFAGHYKTPHLTTGERPGPLLYFADDMDYIENELLSYYWKKNPQGQRIDEPQEHDDHAMDTIKYMLSKLPQASQIVIPASALPPKWAFWHEMQPEHEMMLRQREGV